MKLLVMSRLATATGRRELVVQRATVRDSITDTRFRDSRVLTHTGLEGGWR
jgi:hypothetical protein